MNFRNNLKIGDSLGVPRTLEEMNSALDANYIIPAFRDGIITVDKLLDHVDVVLEWYIPSENAIDFMNFIRLSLGEEPENTNPKAHYFMIDCIFKEETVRPYFQVRNIDYDLLKDRVLVLCTREFSKSTLLGSYLVLYIAAKGNLPGFGRVNYMLYVSDSMRNNVKTTMETIGSVYRESEYLRSLFESARTVQDEINFVRNPITKKEVALYDEYVNKRGLKPEEVPGRMKRTFSMSGLGASTGGRGSRDGLSRPDGVFFDDLLGSEADASSEVILDNIESTIESDILPAMSGNGSFKLFAGTPYNKNDPAYKRIEDGSWLPIVFPKAERMDDSITAELFRGVWTDRHTYKSCKMDYDKAKRADDNGNPVPMRKLNQEYYLRISNDADRMVTDSMIEWFDREDIARNSWKYNWYLTTDYTTTGTKGSDMSGNALWAVDWDGNHYLVDLTLRKLELEVQYNETFAMVKQTVGNTRGIEVGVEVDGQQTLHITSLKDRMPKRNTYFTFARQKGAKIGSEGIRSKLEGGNKHWRFRMMLPYFQNHKIKFARELKHSTDMNELLEEIKYCTYAGIGTTHDDGLDTISQIGMMEIIYPPKDMEAPKKRMGIKPGGINAKIWGKEQAEENGSAYDSYNG